MVGCSLNKTVLRFILPGLCLLAMRSSDAAAEPPRESAAKTAETTEAELTQTFRSLLENSRQLEWDTEYKYIEVAISRIWEQSGWTSEPDVFARDLMLEASAIPPWDFMKRWELFNERISERYGFTPAELGAFQQTVFREVSTFLLRHGSMIFQNLGEAISARSRGKPITAEQVARWAQRNLAIHDDLSSAFQRGTDALRPLLREEQRRILERDAKSARKRLVEWKRLDERWAKGKWNPADWGMENDPIQQGHGQRSDLATANGAEHSGGESKTRPLPRWVAHDPSTWFAYVIEIKRRFGFDLAQLNAASSIHTELVERAVDYSRANTEALKKVPPQGRATHTAYAPIRKLFTELQTRLDAIPTTGQRE